MPRRLVSWEVGIDVFASRNGLAGGLLPSDNSVIPQESQRAHPKDLPRNPKRNPQKIPKNEIPTKVLDSLRSSSFPRFPPFFCQKTSAFWTKTSRTPPLGRERRLGGGARSAARRSPGRELAQLAGTGGMVVGMFCW